MEEGQHFGGSGLLCVGGQGTCSGLLGAFYRKVVTEEGNHVPPQNPWRVRGVRGSLTPWDRVEVHGQAQAVA